MCDQTYRHCRLSPCTSTLRSARRDAPDVNEDDFTETDVPKDFSVISWYMKIPLCDDLWLGMQAQHIAAVEIAIIRPMELHTARRIFNEESYADMMMALNGVS